MWTLSKTATNRKAIRNNQYLIVRHGRLLKVVIQQRRLRVGRFYSRVQFNFALVRVSAAEILQQPDESNQFVPTGIRHGAILQITRLPKDEVITIPRQLLR